MEKLLLIVGLDPGTTLGYALLDFSGKIIKLNSLRNTSLSLLIKEIISFGQPVLVSSDVSHTPKLVKELAIKTGARTFHPKKPLTFEEKNRLTRNLKCGDDHQRDALASALYCYKRISFLLKKIESFLTEKNKEELFPEMIKKVLLERKSIKESFQMLTSLKEEEEIISRLEKEKITKSDFLKLINRLEKLKEENKRISKENLFLKGKINSLEKEIFVLNKKIRKIKKENFNILLESKEKNLFSLSEKIKEKEGEIEELNNRIKKGKEFLEKAAEGFSLIKKIKNLTQLPDQRIIFVEEPNIFSEKILELIKEKGIKIITFSSRAKKIKGEIEIFSAQPIKEWSDFVLINQNELKRETPLKRIIEEYQKERKKIC